MGTGTSTMAVSYTHLDVYKRQAQNHGVVLALEEQLGVEIFTSPLTQYNGALGAALFAYQGALKRAR